MAKNITITCIFNQMKEKCVKFCFIKLNAKVSPESSKEG